MRFSILAAVAVFSSVALGQSLDNLPQCAKTCFGSNTGSCGTADIACICSSNVILPVSCCVFATCSQADIANTIQFASGICKLAGVDVNTSPTCASGTSTPSAGNGTASATPSGSASVSGVTGSASRTPSASAAASSGAAPQPSAGAGLSLGMAMAGLLAAL